jgi:hypothetical protein
MALFAADGGLDLLYLYFRFKRAPLAVGAGPIRLPHLRRPQVVIMVTRNSNRSGGDARDRRGAIANGECKIVEDTPGIGQNRLSAGQYE